ncbi:MAG TPA: DEAD/DEAH box helicase, partial [Planctomycetaceae bacterium]|nr:DEAD/DEAH box helicase [Planctomycetaceae bacterium]
RLIGQKVPVSKEHSQAGLKAEKLEPEPRRGSQKSSVRPQAANGARPPRRRSRRAAEAATEANKAKPGQKKPKWRHIKARSQQTT